MTNRSAAWRQLPRSSRTAKDRQALLAVARGDAEADLVLRHARVVNVFTGEIVNAAVSVCNSRIASVGEERQAREVVDLGGRFLVPGMIDAHVHLESSMVTPYELARAVVPRGTTTVVCDPHEIANVCGLDGVNWLLAASEGLPLSVLLTAPSCVPASRLATSGASLDASALAALREGPRVVGLAEVMNVPGVVLGDDAVHAKLDAYAGLPVDGHAPRLSGSWLDAYAAAGIGSDHECLRADEAVAKLRLGMRVFLRESSGARNLVDLLPAVTQVSSRRCAFATDDRHPHDLLDEGHLDHMIRLAVSHGLDAITALQMASVNAAETFGLTDRGAIAPGRRADLVACSCLHPLEADLVYSGGSLVAEAGRCVGRWSAPRTDDDTVRARMSVDLDSANLSARAESSLARVIGVVPGQIVTEHLHERLDTRDSCFVADPARDIVKLAVLERHHGSGRIGVGFVRGLGLARGALASTVAHDHHNLIVAGADDASMLTAARSLTNAGGGLSVAQGDRALGVLPLPIAGLMSEHPVEAVRATLDRLLGHAGSLGCTTGDPFMTLSFLALEVMPSLRLTDLGLVDVERFEIVSLSA